MREERAGIDDDRNQAGYKEAHRSAHFVGAVLHCVKSIMLATLTSLLAGLFVLHVMHSFIDDDSLCFWLFVFASVHSERHAKKL
jgi:hypothetical protein